MPAGVTKITDVVVPEIFTPYVQQRTEEKSRIIQSGVGFISPLVNEFLAGGGLTFNIPSFQDLDSDDSTGVENVSTDDDTSDSASDKIETGQEIGVRLSRNNSWSTMDLTAALAGVDPQMAIANLVSDYWIRRLQKAFIATMNGVIANNTADDAGDYSNDISGSAPTGPTKIFTAEGFIDAATTMGDSMENLTAVMVHSVVYARMQKNNLIDFIPDSNGVVNIPTFLGRQVLVDDGMPVTAGVYDTWLFGPGAVQLGFGAPKVPTETLREPKAGDGGGQDTLFSRVTWAIHPTGHAYIGTSPNGGPSNAATTNNLGAAASWNRIYPERKQISFARFVTRES